MGFMRPHLFGPHFSTLIPNFAFTIFSGILLYGNGAYFIENLDSLSAASGAIYVMTAMIISIAVNLAFVAQKKNMGLFFVDVTAVVNNMRKRISHTKYLELKNNFFRTKSTE